MSIKALRHRLKALSYQRETPVLIHTPYGEADQVEFSHAIGNQCFWRINRASDVGGSMGPAIINQRRWPTPTIHVIFEPLPPNPDYPPRITKPK